MKCANPDTLNLPDILLMRSDDLVVFDNQTATLTLVTHATIGDGRGSARGHRAPGCHRAGLVVPLPEASRKAFDHAAADLDFVSGLGEDGYKAAVARIKEYIAAGDVMQVVPSQRLVGPFHRRPDAALPRHPPPEPVALPLLPESRRPPRRRSSPEVMVRVQERLSGRCARSPAPAPAARPPRRTAGWSKT